MVKPDTGQANFAEKMILSACPLARTSARLGGGRPEPAGWGAASVAPRGSACRPRHPPRDGEGRVRTCGSLGKLHNGDAVIGEPKRRLETLGKPRAHVRPDHDAVHHHVDVVLVFLVEGRGLGDLVESAVDLEPLEALLLQLGEFLFIFALPPARDRRQEIKPRAFGQRQHAVHHLADGLALDRQARRRRIGDADPRPEQPHIVVELGHGRDRRARVTTRRRLVDRDRRQDAADRVDVRLVHAIEKLSGVRRKRLDVAALALGVEDVERQARLARARDAGDYGQGAVRDLEIDLFQVVLACAPNADGF